MRLGLEAGSRHWCLCLLGPASPAPCPCIIREPDGHQGTSNVTHMNNTFSQAHGHHSLLLLLSPSPFSISLSTSMLTSWLHQEVLQGMRAGQRGAGPVSPPMAGSTERDPCPAPWLVFMGPVSMCHRERTAGSAVCDTTPLAPDGLGSGEDKANWPFILRSETRCPPASKIFPRYMVHASLPGIPQRYWG